MSRVLPILFNTDMVRAIMDGRKTVTRRLIKAPVLSKVEPPKKVTLENGVANFEWNTPKTAGGFEIKTPYQPGDILYVRETWSEHYTAESDGKLVYCYKADGIDLKSECLPGENNSWHPSIHMPKEAARIWLNVKDVRVERLQEITEEQAKAEGIRGYSKDGNLYKYAVTDDWWIDYHNKHRKSFVGTWWQDMPRTAKDAFSYLWNSTIKKSGLDRCGWDADPWVWAIEFERCEKPEGWCV